MKIKDLFTKEDISFFIKKDIFKNVKNDVSYWNKSSALQHLIRQTSNHQSFLTALNEDLELFIIEIDGYDGEKELAKLYYCKKLEISFLEDGVYVDYTVDNFKSFVNKIK